MNDNSSQRDVLEAIERSGGVIVRDCQSTDELRRRIQQHLDDNKACAFVPSKNCMRSFFNTEGFISAMQEIEESLAEHQVLITPQLYGNWHIYAVAPVNIAKSDVAEKGEKGDF